MANSSVLGSFGSGNIDFEQVGFICLNFPWYAAYRHAWKGWQWWNDSSNYDSEVKQNQTYGINHWMLAKEEEERRSSVLTSKAKERCEIFAKHYLTSCVRISKYIVEHALVITLSPVAGGWIESWVKDLSQHSYFHVQILQSELVRGNELAFKKQLLSAFIQLVVRTRSFKEKVNVIIVGVDMDGKSQGLLLMSVLSYVLSFRKLAPLLRKCGGRFGTCLTGLDT